MNRRVHPHPTAPGGPATRVTTRGGERGATLVEAAIVLPLLLFMLFGMIEFGFLFKDGLTVASAARAGARVDSAGGTSPDADFQALQAVQAAVSPLNTKVIRVVVYHSATPDGEVPSNCKIASPPGVLGQCNVFNGPASGFADDTPTSTETFSTWKARVATPAWPPTSRTVLLSSANGPDYVGVWIHTTHDYVTGAFNWVGTRTVSDETVLRLEPDTRGPSRTFVTATTVLPTTTTTTTRPPTTTTTRPPTTTTTCCVTTTTRRPTTTTTRRATTTTRGSTTTRRVTTTTRGPTTTRPATTTTPRPTTTTQPDF